MDRQAIMQARQERGLPNGTGRISVKFPARQLRAKLVSRDGKDFYELDGYATVFNRPYEMYDAFGKYREQVHSGALDDSLSRNPDVVFLENHRGLTMARTTNGTLQLTKDPTGLKIGAWLNAARTDVRDLASAINDELVDEMSFAFMIEDDGYEWNDDYSLLTLTRIDIDRGDVSAVNYGANPYTSIGSRASDLIRELRELPAGALPDAQAVINLRVRDDFDQASDEVIARYARLAAIAGERGAALRALARTGHPEWHSEDLSDDPEPDETPDAPEERAAASEPDTGAPEPADARPEETRSAPQRPEPSRPEPETESDTSVDTPADRSVDEPKQGLSVEFLEKRYSALNLDD